MDPGTQQNRPREYPSVIDERTLTGTTDYQDLPTNFRAIFHPALLKGAATIAEMLRDGDRPDVTPLAKRFQLTEENSRSTGDDQIKIHFPDRTLDQVTEKSLALIRSHLRIPEERILYWKTWKEDVTPAEKRMEWNQKGEEFATFNPCDGHIHFAREEKVGYSSNFTLYRSGKPHATAIILPEQNVAFTAVRDEGAYIINLTTHNADPLRAQRFSSIRGAPRSIWSRGVGTQYDEWCKDFNEQNQFGDVTDYGSADSYLAMIMGKADVFRNYGNRAEHKAAWLIYEELGFGCYDVTTRGELLFNQESPNDRGHIILAPGLFLEDIEHMGYIAR